MNYDVVVAGGGPVGLMLACELRLGGARVVVLERFTEVDPTVKGGAITTPSAEALYRRGMLPALAEVQRRSMERFRAFMSERNDGDGADATGQGMRYVGHFAGIMLRADLVDRTEPGLGDAGPAAEVSFVAQQDIERLLVERADELGVEVRRGVELTGFDEDAEGVTVRTGDGDGDGDGGGTIRASWLVGCDGGRSTVRKAAGFDFPGTDPEITCHQAVVEMTGAEDLTVGWTATDTGVYAYGPMPGRVVTVELDGPPADREAPVTAEDLQARLRRVSGVDVTITEVRTATRFTDHARQVTDYRKGRVLLAGDAAHVHSAFGSQGLSLGIGDAMNLGWKLAAVVAGRAPETLLDTYTAERHPVGAWVLDWTRSQIAAMRPDPQSRALRRIVSDLAETVAGTTYLVARLSGAAVRYALPGGHPLTGRSAPDLELADGSRLADHLHGGRALLLDLTGDPELRARAAGYAGRVDVVTAGCPSRPGLAALLVRPDGFTAWAADVATDVAADVATDAATSVEGLTEALGEWFGAPEGAAGHAVPVG
ncbi:FAD-dependent oxidoreductase [Streptomyces albireticuli]|uniref:FAD-dependent oxidoreductase n=1 Tax=Streptomyces albireticuli TaxID=1940 RepID=UPI0014730AB4|nr:FAD-dependent oxidoreductase [Streptomyces albireticuli]MCD9141563.1 FAD-dependent oxidoreductase [Streptomyces albireticuli]MCD9164186.1 FAD-dependent oxidoreductase [Streptomyces albireticuli]MCD9189737.1 FAD-dependent oxidoreductase [Streptomyces albireticuli]